MVLSRSLVLVALLALTAGGLAWWLWPAPDESERVRQAIRAVVAGAEAGDVGDVLAPMAPGFVAESRGTTVDQQTLRGLLAREFIRRGPIFVLLGEIEVSIEGTHAEAEFDAVLAENSDKLVDLLPVDADAWHLEAELQLHDGEWQITRATRSDAVALPGG